MQSRPALATRSGAAALLLVAVAATAGCTAGSAGDRLARDAARGAADAIAERVEQEDVSADALVQRWIPAGPIPSGSGTVTVEPLAWSGSVRGVGGASIDVRIEAHVPELLPSGVFQPSHDEGSATRCFRLWWGPWDEGRVSDISCPEGAAPERPVDAVDPTMGETERELVHAVLREHRDPAAVDTALAEAFPDPRIHREVELDAGALVVAVGPRWGGDCIVAVRDAMGEIWSPAIDPVWLEQGELGCSTRLHTAPPL